MGLNGAFDIEVNPKRSVMYDGQAYSIFDESKSCRISVVCDLPETVLSVCLLTQS